MNFEYLVNDYKQIFVSFQSNGTNNMDIASRFSSISTAPRHRVALVTSSLAHLDVEMACTWTSKWHVLGCQNRMYLDVQMACTWMSKWHVLGCQNGMYLDVEMACTWMSK